MRVYRCERLSKHPLSREKWPASRFNIVSRSFARRLLCTGMEQCSVFEMKTFRRGYKAEEFFFIQAFAR